jgi:hypothetical protein
MNNQNVIKLFAALALGIAACSSDEGDAEPSTPASNEVEAEASADMLTFRTAPVKVEAGKERFVCFTAPFEEDAAIDGYSHAAQTFVHHVVFARTLAPEPDGLSECDVLFRQTWDPLFITGAGSAKLSFPEGTGHKIKKGTQLLVQLHLLNSSEKDVEAPVAIKMHRSPVADPTPVGTYVLGSTDVHLPPAQQSEVQGTCTPEQPVKLVAAFPHMHWLGKKLTLELGKSMDDMQTVFTRDPYDFDDQHIEEMELNINPGDVARVTCNYDNTTPHEVGFGESTNNEMCFFIGFAVGQERLQSCLKRGPANTMPMK